MFCSTCGGQVEKEATYCSKCGNVVGQKNNRAVKTITKTYRALLGIGQSELAEINAFLKSGNFQKVNWNFAIGKGIAHSLTLICEEVDRPLSYRFAIHKDGSGHALGIFKRFGGWDVQKAINQFVQANPDNQIKATRPVHYNGINTMVYILYTYKPKGTDQ